MSNNIDRQYNELLNHLIRFGTKKQTRNGEVLSTFGWQLRHNMKEGFPLLTCKKVFFKGIVTELLWFLRGDTNIKYLVDNDCHIWDGDCFANYIRNFSKYVDSLPENGEAEFVINKDKFINKIKTDSEFAEKWGDLGPIYGKQWRRWKTIETLDLDGWGLSREDWSPYEIDQITNLINDLKTNPDSRRLMVNAWNVGEIDQMVLPPCHYSFQVYTRELTRDEEINWLKKNTNYSEIYEEKNRLIKTQKWISREEAAKLRDKEKILCEKAPKRAISLAWNQRSVDTFLGLPFNIASYALLLEIIAKEVNMVPEELIGNLGDTHLYVEHIDAAKEQVGRIPYKLPTLDINTEFWMTESGSCGEGPLASNLTGLDIGDFQIENYQSHPAIKAELKN
jgi:thymidylate synthase